MRSTDTAPPHASTEQHRGPLNPADTFPQRHIGPSPDDVRQMLDALGYESLDALSNDVVPEAIRLDRPLNIGEPGRERGEFELLHELRAIAAKNKVCRSFIGMGYHDCITPPVIQRNILENPGWYTAYTPYQAEISQGRLEALLNFQTMVADLTGLPLANASMLDEATAAAEAMALALAIVGPEKKLAFFVTEDCHPQTIAVVRTRAEPIGVRVQVGRIEEVDPGGVFGVLVQYPTTDGRIVDYAPLAEKVHAAGGLLIVAADPLALTLIKPPGEFGADIAIGSAQRFGVPMGYGGPHAAFIATRMEYARKMPGRIIGVSKDAEGRPAYRLAIQTREQHIKRDRATSNICTAQVLLAIMASMYAVYHGPKGLRRIAERVHGLTAVLAKSLQRLGHEVGDDPFFDTLRVCLRERKKATEVYVLARLRQINLRDYADGSLGVSVNEVTSGEDLALIMECFNGGHRPNYFHGETLSAEDLAGEQEYHRHRRTTAYLTHPVFSSHHSETEMLRYLHRLEAKDLSLTTSMIPLGSCTMKLNATSEMLPVTWPEFARVHPFAPEDQTEGYREILRQLEDWLAEITGFAAVSLQPNAGSQGEYAGLLAIRAYHQSRIGAIGGSSASASVTESTGGQAASGTPQRNICLIPTSAHGTNPASAVMAGFKVVPVACDKHGNIDLHDLQRKAEEHSDDLAALMITYPSTHGVFEPNVGDVIDTVHGHGGLVYMDGANMNAMVGLCRPGDIGADVCHLNLHKTFCIPHGGGGPGMGPICVNEKLAPFLPGHPLGGLKPQSSRLVESPKEMATSLKPPIGPVSAAPYGSASILPISWVYIALMGGEGLKKATQVAILNANYMAHRLKDHYPVLYTGLTGRVAHEFILDCRDLPKAAGVSVEDIAKRLMDYGFHAPTMSFPVVGTLMVEPTESESKAELDRLCDALIAIRGEVRAVERGELDRDDNPLRHAPHTAEAVTADAWPHKYSRKQAAYPAPWLHEHKYWPPVARIDNPHGDRHLICTCPTVSELAG